MRIRANPTALAAYGLTLEDAARRRSPPPTSTRPRAASTARAQSYTIDANDQLLSSAEYRPLIVAYRNGAPVRLSDVADVVDDAENVAPGGVDERARRR